MAPAWCGVRWLVSYEAGVVSSPVGSAAGWCWFTDVVFLLAGDFMIDSKEAAMSLSPTERNELLSLAGRRQTKAPKVSTESLETFELKGILERDKYDSLVIGDFGSAVLNHVRSGL